MNGGGQKINIEIKRSKRKTVSIEVTSLLTVVLRLPLRFPDSEIPPLLNRHREWIEKAITKRRLKNEKYPEPDKAEKEVLLKKAKDIIPEKVKYYSELTGLFSNGIKITGAKKRFGSCSTKNSLCFSYLLMRYPEECIDYVVLHEIAHIKHHNHGKDFYNLVKEYMPDYRERQKLLKS